MLVLEAGERKSHARQLEEGVQRSSERLIAAAGEHFINRNPGKIWVFTLGFGGGSNCWWGNTPRMLPADFRLKSLYGVGEDWPFDYDALESFYGDHRRRQGAVLIETANAPQLRYDPGKWRHYLSAKFICEDLRQPRNHVRLSEDPGKPAATFAGHSDYASRALDAIESYAETLVPPLPVERIKVGPVNPAEAHIMGTTVMGRNPRSSVVDGDCVHHRLRNLVVLGSGTFPTASPANPTLTIAAVSLRAAARLTEGGRLT